MDTKDLTPMDGRVPYPAARYFVLDDRLLLRTDGRRIESGHVERWDPATGLWSTAAACPPA
jgi:hypothetical protein